MLGVAEAELEGDAAEDQRQQHDQDREIDRRDDDREGQRERGQQPDAAEHQPGLVAVPDRRDGVHHQVARRGVRREAVEHADAEIEAVEQHVEEDAEPEDHRPDRHEIENDSFIAPSLPTRQPAAPAARAAALDRLLRRRPPSGPCAPAARINSEADRK